MAARAEMGDLMAKYGGTVLKTSPAKDDEELQDALHGGETVAR